MSLLAWFQPLFTVPSFRTFCALAAGFSGQTGRRTVCGMLTGPGCRGPGLSSVPTGSSRLPAGAASGSLMSTLGPRAVVVAGCKTAGKPVRWRIKQAARMI